LVFFSVVYQAFSNCKESMGDFSQKIAHGLVLVIEKKQKNTAILVNPPQS